MTKYNLIGVIFNDGGGDHSLIALKGWLVILKTNTYFYEKDINIKCILGNLCSSLSFSTA